MFWFVAGLPRGLELVLDDFNPLNSVSRNKNVPQVARWAVEHGHVKNAPHHRIEHLVGVFTQCLSTEDAA